MSRNEITGKKKANFLLPYEKLAKIDGKYLAIGIGNRLVGDRLYDLFVLVTFPE